MAPSAAELKAYAPEFATTDDVRINLFIGFAGDFVSSSQWGKREKQALILMACHLMTVSASSNADQSVTSESVGDLSISYGGPTSDSALGASSYGAVFLELQRRVKKTPLVI